MRPGSYANSLGGAYPHRQLGKGASFYGLRAGAVPEMAKTLKRVPKCVKNPGINHETHETH
jgi:hypothetical protein